MKTKPIIEKHTVKTYYEIKQYNTDVKPKLRLLKA